MIKPLKKYQIQVTPFESTYNWSLNNIDNTALLLFESTGSDDGEPYALEFIDYSQQYAFDNYNCSLAQEQQTNGNVVTIDYGLNISGLFYPNTDPQNSDGTYQRMIYAQIKTTFYNDYRDPTKVWGLETLDFEINKTNKYLSDEFRIIYIPQITFGDKVIPNSVTFTDNTLDNPYTIIDDGNENLIAGTNLFSHQQEIGDFLNNFILTESSSYCQYYWEYLNPSGTIVLTINSSSNNIDWTLETGSAILNWIYSYGDYNNGFNIYKSINGMSYNNIAVVSPLTTTYTDNNVTTNVSYSYQINAYNEYGTSSYSNMVSISFQQVSPSCTGLDTGSYVINGVNGIIQPYYDGQLPLNGYVSTGTPWNGEFAYKTNASPSSCTWWGWLGVNDLANGRAQNCISINYSGNSWVMLAVSLVSPGNPYPTYEATKSYGNNPAGTYLTTYQNLISPISSVIVLPTGNSVITSSNLC